MNPRYHHLLCGILSIAILSMVGCGAARGLVDKVTPGKKDLKKRVMVFPFVNHAGFDKASENQLQREFMDLLARSPDLVFHEPIAGGPVSAGGDWMRFGIMLGPDTVAQAQAAGLNAAVIGVLQPFEASTHRRGIWPFRGNKTDYEISVAVSVVDITDTTLLFTQQASRARRFRADDVDERTVVELREEVMDKEMPRILKTLAKEVTKALRHQRWRGRVLEVADGRLRINAGADVGLEPGHRFEVFGRGEIITAQGGRNLVIKGKKAGEIRAETVGETESTAVPVSEGNYEAGQIIRSRP